MIISLIAAHDPNLLIGNDGNIPWHYPEDLKFFKKNTLGFPIVMGKNTFQSIGSRPLPNRKNIVISTTLENENDQITILKSPSDLFSLGLKEEKVFIVGGSNIYSFFLNHADELIITEIKKEFKGDTWFPSYREQIGEIWKEESREIHEDYDFVVYKRI